MGYEILAPRSARQALHVGRWNWHLRSAGPAVFPWPQATRGAGAETDAPSGHGIRPEDAIHRQSAFGDSGLGLRQRVELQVVEDQMLVDVICQDQHVRVAQQYLAESAQLRQRIHRPVGLLGELRISYRMRGVIERLKAKVPDASISVIEIDSAKALVALDEGAIDVAFAGLEGGARQGIDAYPLLTERLGVALPRWHRLATKDVIAMRELADEEFIMFPRPVSPTFFDEITGACRSHGFAPRILHEPRSVTSQIAMVGCSQGIALVPLGPQSLGGELVAIKPLKEKVDIVIIAVARNTKAQDQMVERIVAIATLMKMSDVPKKIAK